MAKNKLTNILLIVLIMAVIVVGFLFLNKPKTDVALPNTQTESFDPKWQNVSKEEFANIVSKDPDVYFEKDFGLTLSQEIDLTGDGINEAIISGNGGNNGVSFILMKDKDGNISMAKQKDKDGTILSVSLLEVGRVMVSATFKLLPNEYGFYQVYRSYIESSDNQVCQEANAYSWNSFSKMFEWSEPLTLKYTKEVCK